MKKAFKVASFVRFCFPATFPALDSHTLALTLAMFEGVVFSLLSDVLAEYFTNVSADNMKIAFFDGM